jgi:hypothetical protein
VAVSTIPDGSGGNKSASTAREVLAVAAVTEKVAEMRTAEEATTVKVATNKAATAKAAVDKAMAEVAADKVVATKVAKEAVAKAVVDVDAAVMMTADKGAAAGKTTMESVGSGSSPASTAGSKRAVAPGGSTPPSKWFRCAWKPRYAEELCSRPLVFIYLYCT